MCTVRVCQNFYLFRVETLENILNLRIKIRLFLFFDTFLSDRSVLLDCALSVSCFLYLLITIILKHSRIGIDCIFTLFRETSFKRLVRFWNIIYLKNEIVLFASIPVKFIKKRTIIFKMISTKGDTCTINIILVLFNTRAFLTNKFNLRQFVHPIQIQLVIGVEQIFRTVMINHPVFFLHQSFSRTYSIFFI